MQREDFFLYKVSGGGSYIVGIYVNMTIIGICTAKSVNTTFTVAMSSGHSPPERRKDRDAAHQRHGRDDGCDDVPQRCEGRRGRGSRRD